jgi:hypothetical protein
MFPYGGGQAMWAAALFSFDPVERTEGDDPNCKKAKVK